MHIHPHLCLLLEQLLPLAQLEWVLLGVQGLVPELDVPGGQWQRGGGGGGQGGQQAVRHKLIRARARARVRARVKSGSGQNGGGAAGARARRQSGNQSKSHR